MDRIDPEAAADALRVVPEQREPSADERRAAIERQIAYLPARAGFGKRIAAASFDESLIPDECKAFAPLAMRGGSMILAGPAGTGKTLAAAWCLVDWGRHVLREKPHLPTAGVYSRSADCIKAGALYRAVFERDSMLLSQARRTPFLVIDDYGAAYEHDWPMAELESVIDARWEDMLPTIVTTNTLKGLEQRMPRAFDRLTGDPGPGVVVLDRPSLRRAHG